MSKSRSQTGKRGPVLIDRQIRAALEAGDIVITPDDGIDLRIQPASLDVRLGDTFAVFRHHGHGIIDPKVDTSDSWEMTTVQGDGHFIVAPGELVLASTQEDVQLSERILARVEGKSSLGRLGLLVHATAGYIDPGWPLAQITLEISTLLTVPLRLYPGMPVAQLAFEQVEPVTSGYSGKYAHQSGPVVSRYHQNWTGSRWT